MPATLSTMASLFKETYEAGIKNQLNSSRPMLKYFESLDTKDWTGLEHVVKVRVNRNRGVYFAAERGARPAAGQQRLESMRIPMRYVYGQIEVTKQLMEASRSNESAVARGLRFEMEGLVDDLRIHSQFALWGFGVGIRALCQGDPGTDTRFEVDSPGGVAGATNGARFLNEGDFIVWVDANGVLQAGGTREITGIATDGTYVDVNAAINTATSDNNYIIKAYGSDASIAINNTDYNHPPMGMLGLVDDGTYNNSYFGLNRTSFPIMRSTVISAVGAISGDVIMRGIHSARSTGKGKISMLWCEDSVLRAYITLTNDQRRYTGGDLLTPDAGTAAAGQDDESNSGLKFGRIPIHTDLDAPYGMMFGLDTRPFARYVMNPGSWVDDDGNTLFRSATLVDDFTADYRLWEQFVNFQPNTSFRLEGISANVVAIHRV